LGLVLKSIILGLGNPGAEYSKTRHNAGFWFTDALVKSFNLDFKLSQNESFRYAEASSFCIIQALTWMNKSGEIFLEPEFLAWQDYQLIVAVDSMDIVPGRIRLKNHAGTAGHNGLKSVLQYRGPQYLPLYIGVGRPREGLSVIDHVLGEPASEERCEIDKAIKRGLEGLAVLQEEGLDAALSYINKV